MPSNDAAPGGIDLLATTLERFVALDGPPAVLVVDFATRLIVRHEALSQPEHQLFSRALILSHSTRVRPPVAVTYQDHIVTDVSKFIIAARLRAATGMLPGRKSTICFLPPQVAEP